MADRPAIVAGHDQGDQAGGGGAHGGPFLYTVEDDIRQRKSLEGIKNASIRS
jgi:hypothetical protein